MITTATLPRLRSISKAPARRAAVSGQFTSQYSYNGGTAIIIDDVCTSGATTDEITGVLKAAGLEEVFVLVIAQTARGPGFRDYAMEFPCKQQVPL